MKYLSKILSLWPIFVLFFLCLIIFFQNVTPGTYLTGWDNLHPEYNFWVNVQRSLFSVWEEYQGLGLLGGHAHSSDLLRQLLLWGLSFLFPQELLRYLSTIYMLFLGSAGVYTLCRVLLFPTKQRSLSLLAAVFYLLNLATIQTFYVPFESFIIHFATLPWMLLAALLYFLRPAKKTLLFLVIIFLLATPAAYIPTLFVVTMIVISLSLLPFLLPAILSKQRHHDNSSMHHLDGSVVLTKKQAIVRTLKLYTIIVLVNAFWLLPFFYFTATNASVNLNSKINQAATQTIYLQNKEYGTISNLMLLQGFWFKSVDPNFDGIFSYILTPWQNHLGNPFILALGYLFFVVVAIGAGVAIFSKNSLYRIFAILFLFVFIALAVATPPFSWINLLIRTLVPLLDQAFRFPFTKFSLFAGFVYAILFSFGVEYIWQRMRTFSSHPSRWLFVGLTALCGVLLGIYTLPLFTGNLFYEKEKIALPQEYKDVFAFFASQDHNTRIANLPQYTFWGWNFYRWGYGGSGFLWYGIKQPMLDRAFDVWSKEDENYYYEMSKSLYSKNPRLVSDVIQKYDITWLLIDKNIIYPPSPKALLLDDLEPILTSIPGVKKEATFGNIVIYKATLTDRPNSFVSLAKKIPTTNTYNWNNYDKAYEELGNYQTATTDKASTTNYYYPFRTLFTDKTEKEREFVASDSGPTITFSQMLPKGLPLQPLRIPSFIEKESIIPATIQTTRTLNSVVVYATVQAPQVALGNTLVGGETAQFPLFTIRIDAKTQQNSYSLNSNGVVDLPIPLTTATVGTTFLTLDQNNIFVLSEPKTKSAIRFTLNPQEIVTLPMFKERLLTPKSSEAQTFSVTIPKIDDNYLSATLNPEAFSNIHNCDNFRQGKVESKIVTRGAQKSLTLISQNATACVPFFLRTLPHREGYAIFITSNNQRGRSLHFWMENTDAKSGSLDTYLPEQRQDTNTAFILPPLEDFGNSYALHFDNLSIGKEPTENTLSRVSIYHIPYNFLTSLVFAEKQPVRSEPITSSYTVEHPNESLYVVTGVPSDTKTLMLSQSYNPGWQAYLLPADTTPLISYVFPFVTGQRLTHFKVNNWENGWTLSNISADKQIVIVYLPQYLQYIGTALLGGVLTYSILKLFLPSRRRSQI